jgi:Cu2+-containing amine oxidase
MISVLVLANESLFADAIVAVLSQEIDLDVVRMSHRELGKGGHYSVIIVVDEEEIEGESIRLKDLIREEITLIVIKVSLESKNIYVFESYQLLNPQMDQVLNMIREFSRIHLKNKPEVGRDSQKKIIETGITQTELYIRNQAYIPVAQLFADVQALYAEK